MSDTETTETEIDWKPLQKRFEENEVGKLSRAIKQANGNFGPKRSCEECHGYHSMPALHIDYVGHATVTHRLLEFDPLWNWEPLTFNTEGLPRIVVVNGEKTLWIKLTIKGVTRLGVGTCEERKANAEKELIGDAIRNAAMRFGVALDLWEKVDRSDQREEQPEAATEEQVAEIKEAIGALTPEQAAKLRDIWKETALSSLLTGFLAADYEPAKQLIESMKDVAPA